MIVKENQSLERKNKSISLAAKVSFQEHEGFVLRPFVLSLFCFKTPYQFALLHKLCHLNFGLTLFGSLVSIILSFFYGNVTFIIIMHFLLCLFYLIVCSCIFIFMYDLLFLFCFTVVLFIVCVQVCTVQFPQCFNPIAVSK